MAHPAAEMSSSSRLRLAASASACTFAALNSAALWRWADPTSATAPRTVARLPSRSFASACLWPFRSHGRRDRNRGLLSFVTSSTAATAHRRTPVRIPRMRTTSISNRSSPCYTCPPNAARHPQAAEQHRPWPRPPAQSGALWRVHARVRRQSGHVAYGSSAAVLPRIAWDRRRKPIVASMIFSRSLSTVSPRRTGRSRKRAIRCTAALLPATARRYSTPSSRDATDLSVSRITVGSTTAAAVVRRPRCFMAEAASTLTESLPLPASRASISCSERLCTPSMNCRSSSTTSWCCVCMTTSHAHLCYEF